GDHVARESDGRWSHARDQHDGAAHGRRCALRRSHARHLRSDAGRRGVARSGGQDEDRSARVLYVHVHGPNDERVGDRVRRGARGDYDRLAMHRLRDFEVAMSFAGGGTTMPARYYRAAAGLTCILLALAPIGAVADELVLCTASALTNTTGCPASTLATTRCV